MNKKLAVLAAGGTGGHLFPAQALAEELSRRGWRIVLATDERGALYADKFPAEHRIPLSAATFKSGDPIGAIGAGWNILQGVMQARTAFKVLDPAVVIGFGGYPSLPALLAAITTKRPTIIHEQNAVLGRVNRFLADKVDVVACAFPTLERAKPRVRARAQVVGNPIRPEVRALIDVPYEPPGERDPHPGHRRQPGLQAAVQRAHPLAVANPAADALRSKLSVVQQQTRRESLEEAIKAIYKGAVPWSPPRSRPSSATWPVSYLACAHLVIGPRRRIDLGAASWPSPAARRS